ncbi:endonuclease/exonuclease/phosphatase family protein [Actinomadura violacea]|uniref:Endonuclease/exonuclease/phosphatase family protein n=1 Tax=Actinomadura violacea TaxID=2819934 RepID=A0ABS3RXP2_9ACTN|nr:endonuclease/exonuclease/phosphatase family protein [Actinomadura violacea]MBO2461532.1 endonuclease/exonuclease/phosphatase family protein [Actinomadura violacea]
MNAGAVVTVATLNLQDGERLDLVPQLLKSIGRPVDILALQEAKGWDGDGQARRFQAEEALRPSGLDRSFLTPSTSGTLHQMVFVRSARCRPVRHWTPGLPDVFHDQVGWLELEVCGHLVAVRSVQWPHWSGDARLEAALKLTRYAGPGTPAIVLGDANSSWPDCRGGPSWWPWRPRRHREFEPDWSKRPPHKRLHKSLPPGARPRGGRLVSDRRALRVLAEAGFVSAGCLAGDMTPTVNGGVDNGQGQRIDHIAFSRALSGAVLPDTYKVEVSDVGDRASDHRLVSVSFAPGRIGGARGAGDDHEHGGRRRGGRA